MKITPLVDPRQAVPLQPQPADGPGRPIDAPPLRAVTRQRSRRSLEPPGDAPRQHAAQPFRALTLVLPAPAWTRSGIHSGTPSSVASSGRAVAFFYLTAASAGQLPAARQKRH